MMHSIRKRTLFSFSGTANNDKGRTAKGELETGFSQMIRPVGVLSWQGYLYRESSFLLDGSYYWLRSAARLTN